MISHRDGGTPAARPSPGPCGSPRTFEDLREDVRRYFLPPLQGLPAALDPVLANLAQKANALPGLAELLPLPWHKLNRGSHSGRRPGTRVHLSHSPNYATALETHCSPGNLGGEKIAKRKPPRRLDQHGRLSPSIGFPFLYQIPRYDGKDVWKIRRDA